MDNILRHNLCSFADAIRAAGAEAKWTSFMISSQVCVDAIRAAGAEAKCHVSASLPTAGVDAIRAAGAEAKVAVISIKRVEHEDAIRAAGAEAKYGYNHKLKIGAGTQSAQRALRQRFLLRRLYKLRYSDAIRDDDDDAWLLLCSSQQFAPTFAPTPA